MVAAPPRAASRGGYDLAALVQYGIATAPLGLLSAATRVRLAAIPAVLPPVFAVGAFELHLAGPDRVDFEACVHAGVGGRAMLAAAFADGWERTVAFLRAWADPESALYQGVDAAWLELDLNGPGIPSPFIVFTLARDTDERGPYTSRHEPALRQGLRLLAGGVEERVMRAVERVIAGLAPTGMLVHAGIRPFPSGPVVRLVARLPRPLMPAYLEQIGWPGSGTEFAAVMQRLCPQTVVHALNLDVGASVGPRLGVEYHFRGSPVDDPRWRSLFDGLVAAGACTLARRDVLARWKPPRAVRADAPLRELLVKVVYESGRPLTAKAYLPYAPGPWLAT